MFNGKRLELTFSIERFQELCSSARVCAQSHLLALIIADHAFLHKPSQESIGAIKERFEPRHALIHDRGGRFEIEDLNTADGTYVNGIPVHKRVLKAGDQIVLGKTVLEFALKESRR